MQEALQYTFDDVKPDSAIVTMAWEKLAVSFRITVSDEETVLPYVRQQLRGIQQYSWVPPNEAAQYCLTKKIDLPEALKWAELSIQNEERFENLATKTDILRATGKTDEADKTWKHAMEIAKPVQLYTYGRQLQREKRETEAMTMFQKVVQQSPSDLFGHMASARLKSHAGDYSGAAEEVKQAIAVSPNDAQKRALQPYVDKLNAKQDINK
jgi:tetratricopeptide (TPR) repeat protein